MGRLIFVWFGIVLVGALSSRLYEIWRARRPICGRCGKPKSKLCGDDFMPTGDTHDYD